MSHFQKIIERNKYENKIFDLNEQIKELKEENKKLKEKIIKNK